VASSAAAAIGRLEDDSQKVVKAALQLLFKLVHVGIFQPPLRAQVRACACAVVTATPRPPWLCTRVLQPHHTSGAPQHLRSALHAA
jgi:hypothetical protein